MDACTGEILIQHLSLLAARAWLRDYERAGYDVLKLPDKTNPNPYAQDDRPAT